MIKRWDLINRLIKENGYKTYLEIGTQSGLCFEKIGVDYKVSVDPNEDWVKHKMTSDEFFDQNKEKFDIIFIDGLHHSEQVYKDILNSLNVLNENGTIVCHDMLPNSEEVQQVPRIQQIWTGDCWKAFVKLRSERNDLKMNTIDSDWGLGVIQKGENEVITIPENLSYKDFENNRNEWMNVVSFDEFFATLV